MRLSVLRLAVALSPVLVAVPARANPSTSGGSGGGGGGALSHVSEGIRDASSGSGNSGSSGGSSGGSNYDDSGSWRDPNWESRGGYVAGGYTVGGYGYAGANPAPMPDPGPSRLRLYAGVEQVHDSDGAVSLEIALEDRWFRVSASATRYFERQTGRDMLTMTVPTLTVGLRLPSDTATRVYAEGGVTAAYTDNDPVMDSTLKGGLIGIRLERRIGASSELVGDAQAIFFNHGVRANAARIGVRFGHLQASVRVLDFDVGPPLYGPEVGIAF